MGKEVELLAKLQCQPSANAQAHFLGMKVRIGRASGPRRRSSTPGSKMKFPKYEPSRLATLPPTLDPGEYDISPETRKAQAERLALRSRLKREYLLQYNDPSRRGLIVSGGRPGTGNGGPDFGRSPQAWQPTLVKGDLAAGCSPFLISILDIGPLQGQESRPTR